MSGIENAVVVRRLYASGFRPEELHEFLSADSVYRGPDGVVEGLEEQKAMARELHEGLSGARFVVEALRVEDDRVEVRWTLHGVHTGSFGGVPPTGRKVRIRGRTEERLEDGRVVERIDRSDEEAGEGWLEILEEEG